MSITDITDTILAEANEKKEEISRETEQEEARIREETARRKQEMKQEHDETLERDKEHRRQQARARANQEAKQTLEQSRRDHINAVYRDAAEKLINLDSDQYRDTIERCASELPTLPSGTVFVPTDRADETREALQKAGVDLETEPSDSLRGGFVINTDKAEYDYSFDGLIENVQHRTELDVARMLFDQQ